MLRMATYAISDIHGAYDEFQRLLDKIRFQYDGSDSLYLLGDYGDWGEKSMETILAVKQMDEEYDFVHCLMGNHELMFLAAMEYGITEEKVSDSAENWLEANHGRVTWEAFLDLPEEEQNGLYEWLKNLPFSCDILLDGRLIMAAHAFPYFYDMEYTQTERQRRKMDAVWRRLLLRENPFEGYRGKKNYSLLVCGHTITDFYYQQMNREAGGNILSSLPGNRNRIYRAERFVDIDCGGKCLSWYGENSHVMHAAERAQLAAYCLETDEEFYVGRPRGPVGELMLGESVPGWTPPEIEVQEKEPPEMQAPEFDFPEPGMGPVRKFVDWAQQRVTKRLEMDE